MVIASIVIPTFQEADNLNELINQIYDAIEKDENKNLNKNNVQVIVVDDNSCDGTEHIINQLKNEKYETLKLIIRKNESGLSSAVIKGFNEALGEILLCMDADLQHPPTAVPKLLNLLINNQKLEYVLGTRYGTGEMRVDNNWPLYRKIISKGARLLARPLTPLSDPMSGFFAIRKTIYEKSKKVINPVGFKIALELFIKSNVKEFDEVEFAFGTRVYGTSKLSSKVILNYLKHLKDLYLFKYSILFPILIFFIFIFIFYLFYLILNLNWN
jgi:dolichol-phosphate mannosyltransferase